MAENGLKNMRSAQQMTRGPIFRDSVANSVVITRNATPHADMRQVPEAVSLFVFRFVLSDLLMATD